METGETQKEGFTVKDISKAVARAREELLGIPQGFYKEHYGDGDIYQLVIHAQQKARKDAGFFWKQGAFQERFHTSGELKYDADHATGILDALKERSQGISHARYEKLGVTTEVIDMAEELLFGNPPEKE